MSDEQLYIMKGREGQMIGEAIYSALRRSYMAQVQEELSALAEFEDELEEVELV